MDGSAVLGSVAATLAEWDDVVDLVGAVLAADVAAALVFEHHCSVNALLSRATSHPIASALLALPRLALVLGAGLEVRAVGVGADLGGPHYRCRRTFEHRLQTIRSSRRPSRSR